ncbi:MAG: hypothetical protein RJA36_798 [Pseudomonadota bacterium]|jgi:hypothetical protein
MTENETQTTAEPTQAEPNNPNPSQPAPVVALPRAFRSIKTVTAAKIVAMGPIGDGSSYTLALEPVDSGAQVVVSAQWVKEKRAEPGGYFVRYADGYESWSPAEAFEKGYVELDLNRPPTSPDEASALFASITMALSALADAGIEAETLQKGIIELRRQRDERPEVQPMKAPEPEPDPVRFVTTHEVNEANRRLEIRVLDAPGSGGASHLFEIRGFDTASNPSCPFVRRYGQPARHSTLLFQNGPIAEVGVNGITHEALLAVVIDRMEGFQAGPYKCNENALALAHLKQAVGHLHARTQRREQAGTEGTHQGT